MDSGLGLRRLPPCSDSNRSSSPGERFTHWNRLFAAGYTASSCLPSRCPRCLSSLGPLFPPLTVLPSYSSYSSLSPCAFSSCLPVPSVCSASGVSSHFSTSSPLRAAILSVGARTLAIYPRTLRRPPLSPFHIIITTGAGWLPQSPTFSSSSSSVFGHSNG